MDSPQTLLHARRTSGRAGRAAPGAPGGSGTPGRSGDPASDAQLLLGRYRLHDQLGAGGFGVVWRAHDELLRREVAVKRIPRTPGTDRDRASREALAAARLQHPAVVALYEACATEDAYYLISELVHGQTLARLIAGRELDDEATLAVGRTLCDALTHAHSRGVIHRDVKPGNVIVPHAFLDGAGGAAAKLTDFGGAWMSGVAALTRTGDVLGTLAYMAPEQAEGRDAVEATDLYSLALVLYEALSGHNPVRGATPAETARRIGNPVPSLARERAGLPRELVGALDRALLARPRSRGTLGELGEALTAALASAAVGHAREEERAGHEEATVRAFGDPERAPTLRARLAARTARIPARPRHTERDTPAQDSGAIFDEVGWSEGEAARADDREHLLRPYSRLRDRERTPLIRARRGGRDEDPATALAGEQTARAADPAEPLDGRTQARPTPRRGLARGVWLGLAAALVVWQAASGRPGIALLLAAASVPLFAIARRSAGSWLLAALAPILGVVGLAGAYPAIVGQLRSWRVRAAIGALGYWWLTLAQPLAHVRLWLAAPRALPPRSVWESSLSHALHVLTPMLSVGVLMGAGVWAAGALVLPLLVRGRSALADAVAVAAWSVALVLASRALDGPLPAGVTHASPRGAVLGALFGAAIALGARALRGPV